MRIAGIRTDGAQLIALGGGVAVVLRGERVSRPLDDYVAEKLGPWQHAPNELADRRAVEKTLMRARLDISLDNPGGTNQYGGPYSGGAEGHAAAVDRVFGGQQHAKGGPSAKTQHISTMSQQSNREASEGKDIYGDKSPTGLSDRLRAFSPSDPGKYLGQSSKAVMKQDYETHRAAGWKPGVDERHGHPLLVSPNGKAQLRYVAVGATKVRNYLENAGHSPEK